MHSASIATNSFILLLMLSISCLCSTRDVYIQPSEGEHCPGTPCYNITTFGKMADSFSSSSGLVVHFLKGTHLLNLQELVVFTNLTNATFKGDNGRMEQGFNETVWQSTVVIKCIEHSNTGIAFVNSSSIAFRYITIANCGADMTDNTILMQVDDINASLGYLNVKNIVIDHISVQNAPRCSLLLITDGSDISITSSTFARNGHVSNQQSIVVPNVIIMYTDPPSCTPVNHVRNVLITRTNVSGTSSSSTGGILMEFSQATYVVTITIDSVTTCNNGDANMWIMSNNLPNYNLTINNSHISGTGAGLYISTDLNRLTCFASASTYMFFPI